MSGLVIKRANHGTAGSSPPKRASTEEIRVNKPQDREFLLPNHDQLFAFLLFFISVVLQTYTNILFQSIETIALFSHILLVPCTN